MGMNNQIAHALDLWIEITGVDPSVNTFHIRDFDVHDMNNELKESLSYDPEQITTAILMKFFLSEYLNNKSFTVKSILNDYKSLTTYLAKCRELLDLLDTEELSHIVEEFKCEMKDALAHYDIERLDVFSVAEDATNLAFLRRDALRSIETLTVHQFAQGVPDTERPIVYKSVHQFWSIDALIQSACRMKSGISLNLICDPKSDASYFVFAYRNGGTVGILTDKPKFDHPLQKYMSRARASGRDFMERIARHHFPYSLMDIAYGDNGRAYVVENTTGLTVHSGSSQMKEIKDLEPDEILWAIMMFSLIEEKMFKQNYKTAELSYTGAMIRSSNIMLETAKDNQLAVTNYLQLDAPQLSPADVTTEKLLKDWVRPPTRINEWIEKRYAHKIPDALLNTLENDGKQIYLLPNHLAKESSFSSRIMPRLLEKATLMLPGNVEPSDSSFHLVQLSDQELSHVLDFSFDKKEFLNKTEQLHTMDSTMIGTAEEIRADLRLTARYNMAKILQVEVDKEFVERHNEIIEWYTTAVQKNLPKLHRAIAERQLIVPTSMEYGFASEPIDRGGNILRMVDDTDHYGHHVQLHSWKKSGGNQYGCIVNESKASIMALFRPYTPQALAILCGCDVSELPDILQHWTRLDHYHGNSILDRIDPMDWAIDNPWAKLNLDIGIYLSKTGYTELQKQHCFKPDKFWIKPKEKPEPNARQVFVKPKAGDEVEFLQWDNMGHERAPERPWIGVVTEVVRVGRVNGIYRIKRHHDSKIITIHGYQSLLIPKQARNYPSVTHL
ncbi:hypothetical protein ABE82_26490 (plasmid) [Paenibacillus peoriae]|nr:hypothetical protein ABE82_26490 [Paenibacillus peoriae]